MSEITKTLNVNLLPMTAKKEELLSELENKWLQSGDHLFETLRNWDGFAEETPLTRYNLHECEYRHIKDDTKLQSQLVEDLIRDVFGAWQNNGMNGFEAASPSYNIPRSGDFNITKRKNPVISIATFNGHGRTAVPISRDGAWERFKDHLRQGWKTTSFRLKRNGCRWSLLFSIKKDFHVKDTYNGVVGVDIGSRTLAAVSILDKDASVKKQLYLGRDIWEKQRDINIRRSKLQGHRDGAYSEKARYKLKRLLGYEERFVKTRCYETAHRVVDLAIEHDSYIAIEDLNGLNKSRLHRKANRRVKRMPYKLFRTALEQVATEKGIKVVAVKAAYTSQICSRCGNIHETSGVLYKCPSCGFVCNRDRNASVNIAHRAGERFFDLRHLKHLPAYDGICPSQRARLAR
jgi:IS605 OrfB family transposase